MSWGLTAVFKWSSEAIATRSALLHVIGWATPAILMIIAVSKQEVSHNNESFTRSQGNFTVKWPDFDRKLMIFGQI